MSELPAEQTWLVLVELLTDLRKKEIEISTEIPKNIQIAKTTINFYKVDPTDPERQVEVKRINEFLTSIQNSLMDLAEEVSSEYAGKWTESVHVLFLDSYKSLKEIDEELQAADAKLNHRSKQVLEGYL